MFVYMCCSSDGAVFWATLNSFGGWTWTNQRERAEKFGDCDCDAARSCVKAFRKMGRDHIKGFVLW